MSRCRGIGTVDERTHRVDLFEYQAREMFAAYGVPVVGGIVATTPAEARDAARELGGGTVVVKAQVKIGGRGKAGGVKLAQSPEEAEEHAEAILGMDRSEEHTSELQSRGHLVCRLLLEKKNKNKGSHHGISQWLCVLH